MPSETHTMTPREAELYKAMREEARENGILQFEVNHLAEEVRMLKNENRILTNKLNTLQLRYDPESWKPGPEQPVQMAVLRQ